MPSRFRKHCSVSLVTLLLLVPFDALARAQSDNASHAGFAKSLKHVEVNGADIPYVEKGRGKRVVLVHGALDDVRVWGSVVDTLAAKYRVIAYSMRGHFPNTWDVDGPDYTAEMHAEDLMGFLKAIKAGRVVLVGHAFGGRVAAIVASKRPDMVAGFVAAEPAILSILEGTPAESAVRTQASAVMAAVMEGVKAGDRVAACRAFVDSVNGPGTFDALPEEQRRQLTDNASTLMPMLAYMQQGRFDCADAKRISCPVLLVHGESTQEIWRTIVGKLAECLPLDVTVIIQGTGHRVVTGTPDAFGRTVMEFLDRL
jgi:pimeloyl-ACP methyl ester carboxylesterase